MDTFDRKVVLWGLLVAAANIIGFALHRWLHPLI
jgi:hypothetical protein